MPNWCSNYASFSHEDPAQIQKVISAYKEGKLFETFIPLPKGEWDYIWCLENWGTKWDANGTDIISEDAEMVSLAFDTAWGPPIRFYNKMTELGFDVDATYYEEGMQFAGHYTSSDGDYSVEYDFNDPEWRDKVEDEDVKELLDGMYESWIDWKEMDEEENADNEKGD